jgi:hypothetical protein
VDRTPASAIPATETARVSAARPGRARREAAVPGQGLLTDQSLELGLPLMGESLTLLRVACPKAF